MDLWVGDCYFGHEEGDSFNYLPEEMRRMPQLLNPAEPSVQDPLSSARSRRLRMPRPAYTQRYRRIRLCCTTEIVPICAGRDLTQQVKGTCHAYS